LTGLNEVSSEILPLFFHILEHVSFLSQTKTTLHNMRTYLLSSNRGLSSMTQEESLAYQSQLNLQNQTGRLLADTLVTMKYFCRAMPLDWMLGSDANSAQGAATNGNKQQLDFIAAFLHMLRERTENVQILAIDCLEHLILRGKLSFHQWFRLVSELPGAINEANRQFQTDLEQMQVEEALNSGSGQLTPLNVSDTLKLQFDFHRALARLLASLLSSYISHINNDKQILSGAGDHNDKLHAYLRLVVDMLHHPSGKIVSEQTNAWVALLRDPQVVKAKILRPFTHEVLSCFMDPIARIRWEDVENQVHPQASLMEASWDDQEEYDSWMADFRSRASLLYRFLANNDPQVASATVASRAKSILLAHGNGDPLNHIDPSNKQLTPKSDAIIQLEALCQPVDNILGGLPSWSLALDSRASDPERVEVCTQGLAVSEQLTFVKFTRWNFCFM
jgi:Exportin-5 family